MRAIGMITIILVLLLPEFARSQIGMDKDFSGSVLYAYLEDQYYYQIDFENNDCIVYDLSYNTDRVIALNPPVNMYLYDANLLSANIFDVDDALEVLAVFYEYIPTSDTSGYYEYRTQIIKDDGMVILDVERNLPVAKDSLCCCYR
ncbi:MAG: hypothetical protein K9G67_14880 [Bacteroidales bacterium]|nr:hypothetical protein [Bacteroidales bacterium]MCF8345069.1 hypothetical protein [Bacteroidales bacterium]MCF8377637.1 hypothetical protein [Bacteroidales bacterium]MCF8402019.1 hypothetical protein [Bacteroidales bacterium]